MESVYSRARQSSSACHLTSNEPFLCRGLWRHHASVTYASAGTAGGVRQLAGGARAARPIHPPARQVMDLISSSVHPPSMYPQKRTFAVGSHLTCRCFEASPYQHRCSHVVSEHKATVTAYSQTEARFITLVTQERCGSPIVTWRGMIDSITYEILSTKVAPWNELVEGFAYRRAWLSSTSHAATAYRPPGPIPTSQVTRACRRMANST